MFSAPAVANPMSDLKRFFNDDEEELPAPVPAVAVEQPRKRSRFGALGAAPPAAPAAAAAPPRMDAPPPLRVDHLGRELDASGNPIIPAVLLSSSAAAGGGALGRHARAAPESSASGTSVFGAIRPTGGRPAPKASERANPYLSNPATTGGAGAQPAASRQHKARKAFNFVEPGSIAAVAEQERAREARRLPVGGFLRPLRVGSERPGGGEGTTEVGALAAAAPVAFVPEAAAAGATAAAAGGLEAASSMETSPELLLEVPTLPPRSRYLGSAAVAVEWWDAPFLPPARARQYAAKFGGAEKAKKLAAGAGGGAEQAPTAPFSYSECTLEHIKTVGLVAHPVPLNPQGEPCSMEPPAPAPMPLMMTADERARLRRRTREERHKAIADQVRIGLLPPPPPKVRLANIMRVLKDSAVADPSAIEAKIKEETAARVGMHTARNLASKLTPMERAEKWKAKLCAHPPEGFSAALFYVEDLSSGQARYKVDINARQLYLVGLALTASAGVVSSAVEGGVQGLTLVYVEGGALAVRRYIKLMLKRIDWRKRGRKQGGGGGGEGMKGDGNSNEVGEEGEDDDDDEEEDGEEEEEEEEGGAGGAAGASFGTAGSSDKSGKCKLMWIGTVPIKHCGDFHFEVCNNFASARRALESRGLAHCWDTAFFEARERAHPALDP